ncbi:hypothetical protein T10_4849 [Trichinella papuae]|uniref:Uncharacterized protein n=1 Tax=Trichinella papuae TaxID=268474 RepID=A0A0V1M1K6_9BILA|nr:hypothetical protein T10_4849 [Trichinella papuae]
MQFIVVAMRAVFAYQWSPTFVDTGGWRERLRPAIKSLRVLSVPVEAPGGDVDFEGFHYRPWNELAGLQLMDCAQVLQLCLPTYVPVRCQLSGSLKLQTDVCRHLLQISHKASEAGPASHLIAGTVCDQPIYINASFTFAGAKTFREKCLYPFVPICSRCLAKEFSDSARSALMT